MQHAGLVVDTPDLLDHINPTHHFKFQALTSGLLEPSKDVAEATQA